MDNDLNYKERYKPLKNQENEKEGARMMIDFLTQEEFETVYKMLQELELENKINNFNVWMERFTHKKRKDEDEN